MDRPLFFILLPSGRQQVISSGEKIGRMLSLKLAMSSPAKEKESAYSPVAASETVLGILMVAPAHGLIIGINNTFLCLNSNFEESLEVLI